MGDVRLDKLLARSGVASRRKAKELVRYGRVRVDGRVIEKPGRRFAPERVTVCVDGQPVHLEDEVYLKIYKPVDVLTTTDDPRGRSTVMDFIAGEIGERVFPVGRLDRESSGLVLLTNDGDWADRIMHPRHRVEKTYLAGVRGLPSEAVLSDLRTGLKLADGEVRFSEVRPLNFNRSEDASSVLVKLTEGRYREIRRAFATIGNPVVSLKRLMIDGIELEGLKPGEWRKLNPSEIRGIL